jgi:hypothetical protein
LVKIDNPKSLIIQLRKIKGICTTDQPKNYTFKNTNAFSSGERSESSPRFFVGDAG